MTTSSLSETLQKMAKDPLSRSETDRLKDLYADIENALQSGVSRKTILEALHQGGFTMSLKMFDKALYRIRSKNKMNGITAPAKKVEAPKAPPSAVSSTPRTFKHNPTPPADLLD